MIAVHRCSGPELTASQLYGALQLRGQVFVVEQDCPYADLDGRDLAPDTQHFWEEDELGVTSYVRVLTDTEAMRIGRVVSRKDVRGNGAASRLMKAALAFTRPRPTVLNAQSHLQVWYEQFGFVASGPDFLEDGIPHVPMTASPAAEKKETP